MGGRTDRLDRRTCRLTRVYNINRMYVWYSTPAAAIELKYLVCKYFRFIDAVGGEG